jgi:hypothetical protein
MGYDFVNGMYMTYNFSDIGKLIHCWGRHFSGMKNSDLKIILKNGITILRHMGAHEKLAEKHIKKSRSSDRSTQSVDLKMTPRSGVDSAEPLKLVPSSHPYYSSPVQTNPNFYWGVGEDGKKLPQDEYLTSYMFVLQNFLDKTEEYSDNYVWIHDTPNGEGFYSNVFNYDPIFEKVGVDAGLIIIDYIGDRFN